MTRTIEAGGQGAEENKYATEGMVIKIGSSTITRNGDPFDTDFMINIAWQVSVLHRSGIEVAIVSSGAVAGGKKLVEDEPNQVAALFGQSELLTQWRSAFRTWGIQNVTEMLFTDQWLELGKTLLPRMLKKGIVIINGAPWNDESALSANNDRLAGWLAHAVGADTLLLLTDVQGVLKDNKHNYPLPYVDRIEDVLNDIQENETGMGTGGMLSKCLVAKQAAKDGIRSFIARGHDSNVVLYAAKHKHIGTQFVPGYALY